MTMTFCLADSAEATARFFLDRGQPVKALALTRRLLARPEAVGVTAARWHRLAATALVTMSRFAAARSHLHKAYRADVTDAETAYRLAVRFETDDDGSPDRGNVVPTGRPRERNERPLPRRLCPGRVSDREA